MGASSRLRNSQFTGEGGLDTKETEEKDMLTDKWMEKMRKKKIQRNCRE